MQKKEINMLCVFPSKIMAKSGTPHRARNIINSVSKHANTEVSLASTDKKITMEDINHVSIDGQELWKNCSILTNYIKKNNINIIIGHTMSSFKLLSLLKARTGVKIITEMHAFREEEGYHSQGISWLRYIRNKSIYALYYFFNDGIITIGKDMDDYISRFNSHSIILLGAVDTSIFNPEVNKLDLGFESDSIVIGYAGNTREYQGVQTVINHFKKYAKNEPRFRLALLLSDRENHSLSIASNKIKLFGPVEYNKVPEFLNTPDILIVPRLKSQATKYSFPSKLFDCMAMEKPVIASSIGDIREVITDEQNGFLYNMDSFKSFEKACKKATNKELKRKVVKNAKQTIKNKYTWEKQGERIVRFAKEII